MSEVKRKQADNEVLFFLNFIAEKEASGLSKKSVDNYKEVYSRFTKEIGEKISKESINKWIHMMIKNEMNPISINYYINQIRVFSYWLMNNGYIDKFEIKKLKTQEPQLKTISEEEMVVLLERPSIKSSFIVFRTWAIINFIMATGARASTIINLKVDDVDFSSKEIRYTHLKNKSSAIIPLSSSLERSLRLYLNTWELGNGFLFPDRFGGQLTINALGHSLRSYCIGKNIRPRGAHSFRHTFAKKYVLNGGNVFILQRLLTHNDLTMTKKYVHLFSSDLKKDYEILCPLDSYQKGSSIIRRRTN